MPIISVKWAVERSFDYVIVGGGTTGLTLAARLSENPEVTVLVVEAGQSHLDDPSINLVGQYGTEWGDEKYRYKFDTEKQTHVGDRVFTLHRGKGLGGSSNLNWYIWDKPSIADANATERLGNPGWGWNDFIECTKRTETFHHPTPDQQALYPGLASDPENRGTSGPIHVSHPIQEGSMDKIVRDTMLGIPGIVHVDDPTGGNIIGTWTSTATVNPLTWQRSTAASGYLQPNLDRKNLSVLTDCLVSRVLFGDSPLRDDLTAIGVEFKYQDSTYSVHGSRIILSAGAINSPQLLELSGIGNGHVLAEIGVDTKIDLPGVGENLQDHYLVAVQFELGENGAQSLANTSPARDDIPSVGLSSATYLSLALANPIDARAIIERAEKEIGELMESPLLPTGLREQYAIQLETLRDSAQAEFHVYALPGGHPEASSNDNSSAADVRYITMLGIIDHPFSRGSLHSISTNASQFPKVDPSYLSTEIDREIALQALKFLRKLDNLEPFKSAVVRESLPGPSCVTEEDMKAYIVSTLYQAYHTIGTCSMLPRDKRGVVDPELRVYGTRNLHVADLSIVPLHVACHPQSLAYAIGEKAAAILKGL